MRASWWIASFLAALLIVFAVQNYQIVELRFLFWRVEVSRALLLFVVFWLGGVVGWIVGGAARARRSLD